MKTSRTNSFRLHRVSRASSLKKQSQTFYLPDQTFKLSAINSVTKGVKNSELSFMTGDDLNKLRVQPIITTDSFYESAHANLTEVRKKYDEAKKQRVNADENIIKLKADKKKYSIFQQQYLDKINEARSQAKNLQDNLQLKRQLVQQSAMQKRVLMNIRHRLKFDKVVYDQRKFDFEKEFSFQNKQLSLLKSDGMYTGQQCDRAEKIKEKLLQELNAERIQRQAHIKNLERMIEERQRSDQHNLARGQQIYQIAQRALQDKNPSEKQWHQIYLTNVFVSKMLRNKIDKQMEKFSVVQFAFKNIKTATGVSDAKTLITKYLNKEAQYGGLLGRITVNQKKISELKQQRDFLLAEQKQLEIEKETLQNVKAKNLDISSELKSFSLVSEHERKMETLLSKLGSWLNKQAKKINSIEKTSVTFAESKKKDVVKTNFVQFCQILTSLLVKSEKTQASESTTPGDLSARDSARVARVVPKRSRKNSVGEQIFDVDEEEQLPINQLEQKQVLNSQRNQILQSNQKFMKQARKRLQEKRKLAAQKQGGGQKKEKKAQIKKEQD